MADTEKLSEEEQVSEIDKNEEVLINYVNSAKRWNINGVVIDSGFTYNVALNIMNENIDHEPQSVQECQNRNDWPKWKDAIQAELDSLEKCKVFGPLVQTPIGVKPVGYKWVFVRKRNEKNEITRYKARLVAQGFFSKAKN